MERKTFAQHWADLIYSAMFATGKGTRKKKMKLSERNAFKDPENRRNDKPGTSKYGRGYYNRYKSVGAR